MRKSLGFECVWVAHLGDRSMWEVRRPFDSQVHAVSVYKSKIESELRAILFKLYGLTNPIEITYLNQEGVWFVQTTINHKEASC